MNYEVPRPAAAPDEFGRHLLVSVDVRGYGRSDDVRQHEIQDLLPALLEAAAAGAGLDRARWLTQPAGDGELCVLPDDVPEARLVDDFVRELHAELRRRNRHLLPAARMRLRLAVHHGVVRKAGMGFSGKGVVEVSRLADSAEAHLALDRSDAELVLVVSQRVFEDTIEQPHTTYGAALFREVAVHNKESRLRAWLLLPGHDIHAVDLDPGAAHGRQTGPTADDPVDAAASGQRNIVQSNTGTVVQARDVHGGITLGHKPPRAGR
jgi:hypothetical protein